MSNSTKVQIATPEVQEDGSIINVIEVRDMTPEEIAERDARNAAAATFNSNPSNFPLTARQIRLGLIRSGIPLSTVQSAIDSLPTVQQQDEAQVYWEFSNIVHWDHPMTQTLISLVGLDPVAATNMWLTAKDYEK